MTVTYTHEVRDCKGFGCFYKLLFRWKGSVYKLVWPDLVVYSVVYFSLSILYRFILEEDAKKIFEKISLYCQYFSNLIPLSFVLGFYVNIVVQRWWAQYLLLPWPDGLSLYVSTALQGQDNRSRMMRRTIVRYLNLASTMTLRGVCLKVKKRFPTYDHLVEAGLLETKEKEIIENMESKTTYMLYWMPLVWAGSVVTRARREKRIKDDFAVKTIIDEINRVRSNLGSLLSYDTISIPLVYTQVVTLAVYTFFLSTILGRQFLDPKKKYDMHTIDFYVPIFTYLQFFFYMGWLKVAESLVNPFGEDDDDFEVNYLIDRNIRVAYMIVDEMHNDHPTIIQDMYWDDIVPKELPYTSAAEIYKRGELMCSTDYFFVRKEDGEVVSKYDDVNSISNYEDVESQFTREKPINSSRSNMLLSSAIRIWRNLGSSVTTGLTPQNSMRDRFRGKAALETLPEISPEVQPSSTPSSERSQKKVNVKEKIQVHSNPEIVLSRTKQRDDSPSQSSSLSSKSSPMSRARNGNRKETSSSPDTSVQPEVQMFTAKRDSSSEERRKSEAESESSDYGTDSKCTSRSSSRDDRELFSLNKSEYCPVYDRRPTYFQSNFPSKELELQNRTSRRSERATERDKESLNDKDVKKEEPENSNKDKENGDSTEFWF